MCTPEEFDHYQAIVKAGERGEVHPMAAMAAKAMVDEYLGRVITETATAQRAILGQVFERHGPPPPRLPEDVNVSPTPPQAKLTGDVGGGPAIRGMLQEDIRLAIAMGATDIRVGQHQVNAQGIRVGTNKPDLQFTMRDGKRVYIEYDHANPPSGDRGFEHYWRTRSNDPSGHQILRSPDAGDRI
jgi:hypothetical protein